MKREDGCVYCESVEQATPKSPRTEAKYQSQLKELEAECAILRGNYKQAINDIEKIILTGTVDYVELNKQLHEYIRYVATYPDNIGQALLDRLAKAEHKLADHGPEGHNYTNMQYMELKDRLQKAEKVVTVAEELIEVASLRGDNELPHPSDDPKPWTARAQEAWDELAQVLALKEGGA